MLRIRFYSRGNGDPEVPGLLERVNAQHSIPYELSDLSRKGAYDEDRERLVYEWGFKPPARLLKEGTGESIAVLRSRGAGHYFLSTPGTLAVVSPSGVEWFAVGKEEIVGFLRRVITGGTATLEAARRGDVSWS